MPGEPRRYLDACVFLNYIEDDPIKAPIVEALLAEAKSHAFEALTSTLSITEVAYAASERKRRALDIAIENKINSLWHPNESPVKVIEPYEFLTLEAQQFIRQAMTQKWKLSPIDAIHLATARRFNVKEFLTWDKDLFKFAAMIGVPIVEPYPEQQRLDLAGGTSGSLGTLLDGPPK